MLAAVGGAPDEHAGHAGHARRAAAGELDDELDLGVRAGLEAPEALEGDPLGEHERGVRLVGSHRARGRERGVGRDSRARPRPTDEPAVDAGRLAAAGEDAEPGPEGIVVPDLDEAAAGRSRAGRL